MKTYLCDVCIPTLNEKGYIETTLNNLADQGLYKKDRVHIIIGDYKDRINLDDHYLMDLCKTFSHVTYLPIFQKGIPIQRNTIIKNSLTDTIVNFDADSMFNREDGIEKMIRPIIDKEVLLTNCEVILFDFITQKKVINPMQNLYELASMIGGEAEKYLVARGQGLTVDKKAFWSVDGFRDIPVAEDYFLGFDICYRYSIHAKRYIDDVKVFTSDRRSKAFQKDGFNVFDYTKNSYR
jgi:glycosyltransferase involved in cell wall biosynthesis